MCHISKLTKQYVCKLNKKTTKKAYFLSKISYFILESNNQIKSSVLLKLIYFKLTKLHWCNNVTKLDLLLIKQTAKTNNMESQTSKQKPPHWFGRFNEYDFSLGKIVFGAFFRLENTEAAGNLVGGEWFSLNTVDCVARNDRKHKYQTLDI